MREKTRMCHDAGESDVFVIVYQFGKVASTAIVATLNQAAGVEAVQSHFLGREALIEELDAMLRPGTAEFFLEDRLGQFQQNLRYTRRMAKILSGDSSGRLVVLSLSRHPLSWLRSAITQDMEAYLPTIRELAGPTGTVAGDTGRAIRAGLSEMFDRFVRTIDETGGIETVIAQRPASRWESPIYARYIDSPGLRDLFLLMLRPFQWFERRFCPSLNLDLTAFARGEGYWHLCSENATYLILRYEDIAEVLETACEFAGIVDAGPLLLRNVSDDKEFAADIRAGFQEADLADLARLLARSRYSRFFGYPGPTG